MPTKCQQKKSCDHGFSGSKTATLLTLGISIARDSPWHSLTVRLILFGRLITRDSVA